MHFPPPCSVSPPLPSTTEDIESSSPSLPPSKIPTLIAVSHPRRFMCREIGVAAAELGGVMWPSALSLTRRMVCGGGFYDVFQHVRRAGMRSSVVALTPEDVLIYRTFIIIQLGACWSLDVESFPSHPCRQ